MSVEQVELERNNKHACTGVVMACEETGRTIASFWHEEDAEEKADGQPAGVEIVQVGTIRPGQVFRYGVGKPLKKPGGGSHVR